MLRLAPIGYNRLFQSECMQATFGGAEANVAVSLANFKQEVAFVTKVPDNEIGNAAIMELRKFNVDTSHIACGGKRLGIYYLEKGASQRGSLCVYDRINSSFQESNANDYDWNEIFKDVEWFHFTGITPALGQGMVDICEQACVKAKEKNIKISCDLNYRSKLWSKEEANNAMNRLCKYVDICISNEEDAFDVFGIQAQKLDGKNYETCKNSYVDVAKQLKQMFGFELVAITLRNSISANDNVWSGILFDGNKAFFSREYELHIVDRVGGGDSFGAGLIYALINGFSCQECVDFATASSALKHTIEGDFNRVTVEEVKKLLASGGNGRIQR